MTSATVTPRTSFFSIFSNMKIITKTSSGFALVLTILATVAFMSYRALDTINNDVNIYSARVAAAQVASEIDRHFIDSRRHVREFGLTANREEAAAAKVSAKAVQDEIEKARKVIRVPERRQKLDHLDEQAKLYIKNCEKIGPWRNEQTKISVEVLDPTGKRMREELNKLAAAAVTAGNPGVQSLALEALQQLMVFRLYANELLDRHDEAAGKIADGAEAELTKLLANLDGQVRASDMRASFTEIKALHDRFVTAYKRAVKLAGDTGKLLNGEMRNEGRTVAADAAAIKSGAIADQGAVERELHHLVESAERTAIILAGVGLAIGIVLALLIGRAISRPIVGMTEAMQKLANGDRSIAVPGVGRKDEVGQMATTLEVFKQNLTETDRMREEQERQKKQAEIDKKKAMNDLANHFEKAVGSVVEGVSSGSPEMRASAESLSATAEETSRQATAVAAAAEQDSTNVQTVASAAEELSSSITEISRQVQQSASIAGKAVNEAQKTNETVQGLAEAANKIGEVVKLINDIASQTNLLALNATIEAARAGEAGKGFAVVASEVKSLAAQTAKATEEIASQINAMQSATGEAVTAIKGIGSTIGEINSIATTIASAVEEQGAATQEIARNVQQAAAGTTEVTSNIGGVTQASQTTGAAAAQMLSSAGELSQQSEKLRAKVDKFLVQVRAA